MYRARFQTEVLENVPPGTPSYEAVRAAGYPDAADRMEELAARIKQRQEADQPEAE